VYIRSANDFCTKEELSSYIFCSSCGIPGKLNNKNADVHDRTLSDSEDKKVLVKTFLLNKKERYEYEVKETGIDSRKDEVKELIQKIANSEKDMYERRKNIEGFDFIMADGKVPALLMEAIDSYILGNFFATIALCGMSAERLLRFYRLRRY
jgi:hypothetical protein